MNPYFVSSRRAFLQLLGAAGSTCFLPSLLSRKARAASAGGPPTRMLFVYGMGSIRLLYPPKPTAGNSAPTLTQFELGELHRPLAGFKDQLVVLDGLDMLSAMRDTSPANGHTAGGSHALTGTNRLTGALSSGISIDQFIAKSINSPAPVTKYPMWEAMMYGDADREGGPSYIAPAQVNPFYAQPKDVLKLFPEDLAAGESERAAQIRRERAALDYALAEYSALAPRLSRADRDKVGQHTQGLRDISAQLDIGTSLECAPPNTAFINEINTWTNAAPNVASMTMSERAAFVLKKAELMTRMFVSAFTCDLIRVGLLHLPTHDDLTSVIGFTAGMFGAENAHDLTHKTGNERSSLWNNPDAMAVIKKVHTTQSQLLANLLTRLESVTESDGRTLLDHTIVVWCGQMGQGDHYLTNLPWMLAGGGGDYFKTGRYVKFARNAQDEGPAHNDLFVSLANAMGIAIDTFGNPEVCAGPLPGLT